MTFFKASLKVSRWPSRQALLFAGQPRLVVHVLDCFTHIYRLRIFVNINLRVRTHTDYSRRFYVEIMQAGLFREERIQSVTVVGVLDEAEGSSQIRADFDRF